MNTYFSGVKTYLNAGHQIALELYGNFAHHTVKVLEHIRQDARLASATVILANILFLEVAVRVIGLVDRVIGNDAEWSQPVLLTKSIVLLTLLTGMLVGMNAALVKGLKLPLDGLKITAISTGACASYILFRLWLAKD